MSTILGHKFKKLWYYLSNGEAYDRKNKEERKRRIV